MRLLLSSLALGLVTSFPLAQSARGPVKEICNDSVRDQATGGCVHLSTQPVLGLLYPLSSDLFVDPFGHVGLGTTSPVTRLDVDGTVRSRSGGFEFPDGTVQTTAAPGTVAAPTTPFGSMVTAGCSVPSTVYELSFAVTSPGGNPKLTLTVSKDLDLCTYDWARSAALGQILSSATVTVGPLTLDLSTVQAMDWAMQSLDGALPRERLTLAVQRFRVTYTKGSSTSFADWNLSNNGVTVSPSISGKTISFVKPDVETPPKTSYRMLDAGNSIAVFQAGNIVLERDVDVLTPSLFGLSVQNGTMATVTADVKRYLSVPKKEVSVLGYALSNAHPVLVAITLGADGSLHERLELGASTKVLLIDPDGNGPLSVTL